MRQKFDDFYEEAYAGELKSIIDRQAAWKFYKQGMRAGEIAQQEKIAVQVLDILDELTPQDAEATEPVAVAYQRIATLLLSDPAAPEEKKQALSGAGESTDKEAIGTCQTPRFPVGRCKHCGQNVLDAPQDGQTIIFCSYECYCMD